MKLAERRDRKHAFAQDSRQHEELPGVYAACQQPAAGIMAFKYLSSPGVPIFAQLPLPFQVSRHSLMSLGQTLFSAHACTCYAVKLVLAHATQ